METKQKNDVSGRYAKRPLEELSATTGKAFDAFCQVLTKNDYTLINDFIGEISQIRLEEGFPLPDVQKAFELYREIVIPILIKECPRELIPSTPRKRPGPAWGFQMSGRLLTPITVK